MSNRMDWMLFTWDLYRCCKIRIRSHLSIRPCITVVGCVKCFADNFSKKFKFNLWRLCNSNFLCFERDYRPTSFPLMPTKPFDVNGQWLRASRKSNHTRSLIWTAALTLFRFANHNFIKYSCEHLCNEKSSGKTISWKSILIALSHSVSSYRRCVSPSLLSTSWFTDIFLLVHGKKIPLHNEMVVRILFFCASHFC